MPDHDLFETMRSLPGATKVANLRDLDGRELNFLYFICPGNKGGIELNQHGTGLRTRYSGQPNTASTQRVARVAAFMGPIRERGIPHTLTAIFANADAAMLFPIPILPPPEPHPIAEEGGAVVPNFEVVWENMRLFTEIYRDEPWRCSPQQFVKPEGERLRGMLPPMTPPGVADDFVRRTFAGFALDGILMRKGLFGKTPVLIGVESYGVAVLQNAALRREDWIPVIQL